MMRGEGERKKKRKRKRRGREEEVEPRSKRYGFYDFGMEPLNLSMDLWFCIVIILSKPRVCWDEILIKDVLKLGLLKL